MAQQQLPVPNDLDDLRPTLNIRLQLLEGQIDVLVADRENIDTRLVELRSDADDIRAVMRLEARRIGDVEPEPELPEQQWLTMRLRDIAEIFIGESLTKGDMRTRLQAIGYDFGNSNPGRAIHFGWVGAQRRLNRNGEAADS